VAFLLIRVQPREDIVPEECQEYGGKPHDYQDGRFPVSPTAGDACVHIGSEEEPGDQTGGFLGVPAPVSSPGNICPERSQDNRQRQEGKPDDDGLVAHGIKYGFFVEKALQERLEREELKEDLLDMKMLREEEKSAVSFEEYLKVRNV